MLSPRGRRLRRWSFLLTLPAASASAVVLGVGSGLGLVAARMVLWLMVIAVARRVGGERGQAVRDLLVHPAARRYARVEMRVLVAPVLALARSSRTGHRHEEFAYHRGDQDLPVALALTPAVLAEAAVFQLLLPDGWLWVHLGVAALHAYGLLWLFALAAGPRLRPHRLTGGELLVRSGVLHEVRVPLSSVLAFDVRRQRVNGRGLTGDGATALLPARRRVDAWIELDHEVPVSRPIGEPVLARRLGIAVDDPQRLASALTAHATSGAVARGRGSRARFPALAALPEVVYGS